MNKRFLSLLMLLIITAPLFAQVDRSKMPGPGPAPEIKIGDYKSFELENGLKVFVVENDNLPRISIQLTLDRDPIFEGENVGYINAAGQLMRTGTANKTKDQLDEAIDFIGASLSTSSTGVFASGLSKQTEKIMELMSEVVLTPNFTQDELDKIKKQMISGIQSQKDDPNAIMGNVRPALIYGKDHPYGELMTEENVESITLEMCNEYYKNYFRPNIGFMAIVGDIDFDDAKDLVEDYFGSWVKAEVPTNEVKASRAPLIRKVALVDRSSSVQSIVDVAYPVKLEIGSDDAIVASLLNMIFGGSFSGRLNLNLREDKGYTYGARSSLSPDEYIADFSASTSVRNAVTDSTVDQILEEMKKIRTEGVTQDELSAAQKLLTGSFGRSLEQPQTVANFAINIARYGLDKDYYKNYLKRLNSVTVEEVNKAAKKFIKPNNAFVIVVGNADEVAEGLKKFSVSGKLDYYDNFANEVDPAAKALPAGVTIESVIDNYINAIGGRDAVSKVNDLTMEMKGTVQGMEVTVKISRKAPNKYYFNLDVGGGMMTQIQKFDGEEALMSGMGQNKKLEGDDLESMKTSSIVNAFLDFASYGITPELVGMETVAGKNAYKVVLNLPNGKKSTEYYDAETGFKVKEIQVTSSPQGDQTISVEYSDYKEVDGVMYAHTIAQQVGPMNINMTVSNIEVNKGLEDALFEVE
ncbi:MAG: insulinase family protein [Melioribacteraceae bacterium]|nr:insulinase family protein [Melioribacteraceae bacterium]